MQTHVILSLLSDDKPGVVEALAELISDHGGNWLESSLSQLAGKFAGIVRISVSSEHIDQLKQALANLEQTGIKVAVEDASELPSPSEESKKATISATGPDRPGIVREVAQAIASYGVNVESLETACSSMPYSGEPIFEAEGILSIPSDADFEALQDDIDRIADELAMDIKVEIIGS